LKGCSEVIRPQHYEVANAIGVTIAQVGAEIDRIFSLDGMSRAEALRQAEEMAIEECVKAGAQRDSRKRGHTAGVSTRQCHQDKNKSRWKSCRLVFELLLSCPMLCPCWKTP